MVRPLGQYSDVWTTTRRSAPFIDDRSIRGTAPQSLQYSTLRYTLQVHITYIMYIDISTATYWRQPDDLHHSLMSALYVAPRPSHSSIALWTHYKYTSHITYIDISTATYSLVSDDLHHSLMNALYVAPHPSHSSIAHWGTHYKYTSHIMYIDISTATYWLVSDDLHRSLTNVLYEAPRPSHSSIALWTHYKYTRTDTVTVVIWWTRLLQGRFTQSICALEDKLNT